MIYLSPLPVAEHFESICGFFNNDDDWEGGGGSIRAGEEERKEVSWRIE